MAGASTVSNYFYRKQMTYGMCMKRYIYVKPTYAFYRSTLVCNMLSYVEFYRPSYFLLENVVGLLHYPLKGRMVGRAFVEGIRMGVVKFIVRTLTCLGLVQVLSL